MRIGIIGAGHIGGTLAKLLAAAGHEVALANSRGPSTLEELVGALGDRAHASTPSEAVAFGEVVIVAVPFGRYREIPSDGLAGKAVIDTTNYYPQRDGQFVELDDDTRTSSELLQDHLAGALVIKAFNAVDWDKLLYVGRATGDPNRVAIPISGDDPAAKASVCILIDQIGFDAVDAGTLALGGRRYQRGSELYDLLLTATALRNWLRAEPHQEDGREALSHD